MKKKHCLNPTCEKFNLLKIKTVTGITVNEITTRKERIKQLVKKYEPGYRIYGRRSIALCVQKYKYPFLQMRTICNYIGERDKSKWMIKESLII